MALPDTEYPDDYYLTEYSESSKQVTDDGGLLVS